MKKSATGKIPRRLQGIVYLMIKQNIKITIAWMTKSSEISIVDNYDEMDNSSENYFSEEKTMIHHKVHVILMIMLYIICI